VIVRCGKLMLTEPDTRRAGPSKLTRAVR
jgi:hypothetical protein